MTTTPGYWQSTPPHDDGVYNQHDEPTRADAMTFRLHQQFVRAHGAPKGELTTLVTNMTEGGVFMSGGERRLS